jgi:hypothetical protein
MGAHALYKIANTSNPLQARFAVTVHTVTAEELGYCNIFLFHFLRITCSYRISDAPSPLQARFAVTVHTVTAEELGYCNIFLFPLSSDHMFLQNR